MSTDINKDVPSAGPPPPTKTGAVPAIGGAFELLDAPPEFEGDKFNLKPRENRLGPIPEDQRKISHEVYAVRNTMKLLQKLARMANNDYNEFIERVKQAARVGCTVSNVDTVLAAMALDDIRGDVVRRYGRMIAFRYLLALAAWAVGGVLLGFIVIGTSRWIGLEALSGYGYLLVGSMVGAWLSVAASRWEIAFDGIQEFVDTSVEPPVRLLFVGLLAMAFGLFLQLGIIPINVDKVPLATFSATPELALFLGIIAGVGEKALSMQLLTRAKQVFTTTS
ncbi:MAG TPA: hypothetical protein VNW72_11155 [Chthoniobacterales bacterium]|jgi:hypothetical protein|nr:hypothetical protein [Chthoniobacterales bacterium]